MNAKHVASLERALKEEQIIKLILEKTKKGTEWLYYWHVRTSGVELRLKTLDYISVDFKDYPKQFILLILELAKELWADYESKLKEFIFIPDSKKLHWLKENLQIHENGLMGERKH